MLTGEIECVSGQGLKNIFIIINPAQRFSDLKSFLAFF
jgi:hypothetical protein